MTQGRATYNGEEIVVEFTCDFIGDAIENQKVDNLLILGVQTDIRLLPDKLQAAIQQLVYETEFESEET